MPTRFTLTDTDIVTIENDRETPRGDDVRNDDDLTGGLLDDLDSA